MTSLQHGVILDAASLGSDVNLDPLLARLPHWEVFDETDGPHIVARAAAADVLVLNKVTLSEATLAALPRLKLIATLATGVNQIDLKAAATNGIAVANARNYATESVAQHVFAMLLSQLCRLDAYERDVRSGRWSAHKQFCLLDHPISELAGKIFGIIGFGALGQRVAQLAQNFGARVIVAESLHPSASGHAPSTPTPPADPFQTDRASIRHGSPSATVAPSRVPLDEVLARADIVSLHLPLTDATHQLINTERLALMKPGAILINTARGGLIDSQALAAALRAGRPGFALLDVLDLEPPPPDHPLLDAALHGRLRITPHTAWASRTARQNVIEEVIQNIAAFQRGDPRNRIV
ncbi:MAG: NAD(P)-dependent oxidoreductase [Thioalkalivibrionaceae bacterium]